MSWEKEEREKGITRREWVRVGMAAGAVGAVLGLGGLSIGQLLPPPLKSPGEIRETIQYTKFPPTDPTADLWWNSRAGTAVRVSDFDADWKGATGVWRGLFSNGQWVPGTGFPVLIIRIKREDQYFSVPPPEQVPGEIPPGFSLYFDDPDLYPAQGGTRIVVLFDRCVHLCCYPGWHVVSNPPPFRTYDQYTGGATVPTYDVFGVDPVYCVCHGSQYDPMVLVVNTNDKSGAAYVGAWRVHGPAPRALPVVPVRRLGQTLEGAHWPDGRMANPAWYVYC